MKIATWNVERLKHKRDIDGILSICKDAAADILVLTETDDRLVPEYDHCFRTDSLAGISDPTRYKDTENRVSIYTNFDCIRTFETYDRRTAVCVELATELGPLVIYGTIIGSQEKTDPSYKTDLSRQLEDISRLCSEGHYACMIGDYNCSFADNYYFTVYGREAMLTAFAENKLKLLTRELPESIDHIAISNDFLKGSDIQIREWNIDKRLSDHKVVAAEIGF